MMKARRQRLGLPPEAGQRCGRWCMAGADREKNSAIKIYQLL